MANPNISDEELDQLDHSIARLLKGLAVQASTTLQAPTLRRLVLAIDYDGTLDHTPYPGVGLIPEVALNVLQQLREDGHELILWTCREGAALEAAVNNLRQQGFVFDFMNRNADSTLDWMEGDSRKIFAHFYLDDRAALRTYERIDWVEFYYQVVQAAIRP